MSMSDTRLSKVISGQSETNYKRWKVPSVQSVEQEKQEQAGFLTASQLEELQKQAYDEGFKLGKKEGHQAGLPEGLEDGRKQGIEKGQEEVEQIIKRFSQIMQFLAEPLSQVNKDVEEELINLSLATAKQIIRREITIDPGQIVAVIKESLSALPSNSKKIKVFLHPADAQIARENLNISTQKKADDTIDNMDEVHDEFWSIIDEPTIARGGCQVKSEFSRIDASIETRIAEISAGILGSERMNSDRDDSTAGEITDADKIEPESLSSPDEEKNVLSSESDSHMPDSSHESDEAQKPDAGQNSDKSHV